MDQNEKALRQTYDHIDLVQRFLASAQIELMRRQFTHDRSKLQSPEWEMFAEITQKLEGLTYGSPEYEDQRQEMLGTALWHHYEHNRHHPEHFPALPKDEELDNAITELGYVEAFFGHYPNLATGSDIKAISYAIKALKRQQEERTAQVNGMNLFDLLEMFIDWNAACKRHADGDIYQSIKINKERFGLSDQLVRIFENTVPWIRDEFSDLKTQKDLEP